MFNAQSGTIMAASDSVGWCPPLSSAADTFLKRTAAGALQVQDFAGNAGTISIGTLTGPVTITGTVSINGSTVFGATNVVFWNTRSVMRSPADGQWNLENNAQTSGIGFDVTTDGLLTIKNRAQNTNARIALDRIDLTGIVVLGSPGTGAIGWNTGPFIYAPADGQMRLDNNASSIGVRLKFDSLPTVASGFGTSPSIIAGSTPLAGAVNVGTGGVATSGVVNFNGTAFPSAPFAVASYNGINNFPVNVVTSTTQITFSSGAAFPAGGIISWICVSAR